MRMSHLRMKIYSPFGVESTVEWANEGEYQQAKKFLKDNGVLCAESKDDSGKRRDFFYIETMQQFNAFHDFRKSLTETKKQAPPAPRTE
jgi:hypothetical protein